MGRQPAPRPRRYLDDGDTVANARAEGTRRSGAVVPSGIPSWTDDEAWGRPMAWSSWRGQGRARPVPRSNGDRRPFDPTATDGPLTHRRPTVFRSFGERPPVASGHYRVGDRRVHRQDEEQRHRQGAPDEAAGTAVAVRPDEGRPGQGQGRTRARAHQAQARAAAALQAADGGPGNPSTPKGKAGPPALPVANVE